MPKKIFVGIDLGTSRGAYAYSIQGRAKQDLIIRARGDSLTCVSALKTDTIYPHDVLAFGRAARERFVQNSERKDVFHDYGGVGVRTTS